MIFQSDSVTTMMIQFLIFALPIISKASEIPEYLSRGVIFNEESKILLAEKFINVEFLLPFPTYNFSSRADMKKLLTTLKSIWKAPTLLCPLDTSTRFNKSTGAFNLDWLLTEIDEEIELAKTEVNKIREECSAFLKHQKSNRVKRAVPVAAALMAGIGLFGGGIMLGGNDCGITGIFGQCQNYGRANAANIERLNEYATVLTDYVLKVENGTNENFFLISNELSEIQKAQIELTENQNKNWEIVQKQFDVFEQNIHILRDCNELLFSNQQLNFNFDTVSSLLSILYADTKSYRSALYAYKVNLLSSIPILLSKRLPMSLVPRESLLSILESVYDSQKDAVDRLTLAIPMTDLLSYYDAQLLREISTVKEGLLLTLAIPLASSQTAFDVYRAQLIPMPQQQTSDALQWVTEGQFLAISEDSMETTVLSKDQFNNCLGSSRYKICHETLETHLGQSSCLATLYFHTTITAFTVCDTEVITLPTPEKAKNLGYGIWLITSATKDFTLREYSVNSDQIPHSREYPGCNICIITLECGTQLISKHIKIRPDLQHCSQLPAATVEVRLADPLEQLITTLPNLTELPYFDTKTDANLALIKRVRTELIKTAVSFFKNKLQRIAAPIVKDMQLLKPTLVNKLHEYVPIKLSLTLTIVVFFGNLFLHILAMYLYHRFSIFKKLDS